MLFGVQREYRKDAVVQATNDLPLLTPAYRANSRWLLEHLAEVVAAHPNQWVAIDQQRVVAADADLGVVTAATERLGCASDAVVHFADDGSLVFSIAAVPCQG